MMRNVAMRPDRPLCAGYRGRLEFGPVQLSIPPQQIYSAGWEVIRICQPYYLMCYAFSSSKKFKASSRFFFYTFRNPLSTAGSLSRRDDGGLVGTAFSQKMWFSTGIRPLYQCEDDTDGHNLSASKKCFTICYALLTGGNTLYDMLWPTYRQKCNSRYGKVTLPAGSSPDTPWPPRSICMPVPMCSRCRREGISRRHPFPRAFRRSSL